MSAEEVQIEEVEVVEVTVPAVVSGDGRVPGVGEADRRRLWGLDPISRGWSTPLNRPRRPRTSSLTNLSLPVVLAQVEEPREIVVSSLDMLEWVGFSLGRAALQRPCSSHTQAESHGPHRPCDTAGRLDALVVTTAAP